MSGALLATIALAGLALALIVSGTNSSAIYIPLAGAAALLALLSAPANIVRGIAAVCASVALFCFAPTSAPFPIVLLGFLSAAVFLFIGMVRGERRDGASIRPVTLWLSVVFLVGQFLTTAFTQSSNPFLTTTPIVIPGLLAIPMASQFGRGDLRTFARGFTGFAVVQLLVAVIDLVRPVPFLGYSLIFGDRLINPLVSGDLARAQGLVGHPIILGLVMTFALIFVWRNSIRANVAIRIALSLGFSFGIVLSGTRSAVLAVALGLVFLIIFTPSRMSGRVRNVIILTILAIPASLNATVRSYVVGIVEGLATSGSYTHRAGAFDSIPNLLSDLRSPFEVLLGSGVGAEGPLFAKGLLQQDGLNVVDNQLVTTLIVGGLIGAAILLAIILISAGQGSTLVRAMLLIIVILGNAFDLIRWPGPALIFFLVVAMAANKTFSRAAETSFRPDEPAEPSGTTGLATRTPRNQASKTA
jgi:hypothetical protein